MPFWSTLYADTTPKFDETRSKFFSAFMATSCRVYPSYNTFSDLITFFLPYCTNRIRDKITYLEIINVSFLGENPSRWSTIEWNLRCMNDVIINFGISFCQLFRKVIFLFCELFQIKQLNRLIKTKTHNFLQSLIKIRLRTRKLPLIRFKFLRRINIPKFQSSRLMRRQ